MVALMVAWLVAPRVDKLEKRMAALMADHLVAGTVVRLVDQLVEQ